MFCSYPAHLENAVAVSSVCVRRETQTGPDGYETVRGGAKRNSQKKTHPYLLWGSTANNRNYQVRVGETAAAAAAEAPTGLEAASRR